MGNFTKALDVLGDLFPTIRGVLKLEQHVLGAAMLVQLRRSLHRYDWNLLPCIAHADNFSETIKKLRGTTFSNFALFVILVIQK
jgi:hypothetical protein